MSEEKINTDTERLEWMALYGAAVYYNIGTHKKWVEYTENGIEIETLESFDDWRDAIDAAMEGQVYERF